MASFAIIFKRGVIPFAISHFPFHDPPFRLTIDEVIRPTVARVSLEALRANLRALQSFLSSTTSTPPQVIAVVKANAYGHGAAEVGRAFEEAGAAMLACADIEEGLVLRQAGVRAPILVFGALSVSDLEGIFSHHLTPTISTPSAARALQAAAARHGVRLSCHLKIDTGMNRLGFRHDNLARTLPEIARAPNLEIAAVYTHFATADNPEHPAFARQRERFDYGEPEARAFRDAIERKVVPLREGHHGHPA